MTESKYFISTNSYYLAHFVGESLVGKTYIINQFMKEMKLNTEKIFNFTSEITYKITSNKSSVFVVDTSGDEVKRKKDELKYLTWTNLKVLVFDAGRY